MSSYLLQEDGASRFILEDGSGFLLLEDGAEEQACFTYAGTAGTRSYAGTIVFTYAGTATVTFSYGGSC